MNVLDSLLHSLKHPLWETLKMAPILFLAYLLMEWLEHHEGSKLMGFVNKSRRVGPMIGSALGLIPQCGFSGAVAGMYAAGTVTAGTLLAVILSTSDEMLPLMLGARLSIGLVVGLLVMKFLVGVITGYVADFFLKKNHKENSEHIHEFCEQEKCSCSDGVFVSALKHTIKILLIIYIVSVVLHFTVEIIPEEVIKTALNFPVVSQIVTGIVGLIPSCAVSVTLTQLYIEGTLGIAPLMCGLLTNGGVGLLVLYRVNRNRKDNLFITLTILISGILFGSLSVLFF